jgi:pimeloyl-ACP methyl ester carboxylesterase
LPPVVAQRRRRTGQNREPVRHHQIPFPLSPEEIEEGGAKASAKLTSASRSQPLVEASVPLDGGATKVHCWRFQPGAVDARPVLVLLHGFGPPATWQWRRQVGPLSRRFRLIITDLLFFGGSSTSVGTRISEVQQAEAGCRGRRKGRKPPSAAGEGGGRGVATYLSVVVCAAGVAARLRAGLEELRETVDAGSGHLRRGRPAWERAHSSTRR